MKALIERGAKRLRLSKKFASRRETLKSRISDKGLDLAGRYALVKKLARLPRNSSRVRLRNRCIITGRPRGVYSRFGICRHKIRELASLCVLPGLIKSSW